MPAKTAQININISNRKSLLLYAIGQLVILLVFYGRFLVGAKSFFFQDITQFFEPLCRFVGNELAHGHLPLWNPFAYCGMPQVAITSPGLFYPPNLLFACLPFNPALALNMVLHQLICGVGGFLIVMDLGWGVWSATICGATLAMSGYMFSVSSNYTLAATAAWCPISFWSLTKMFNPNASLWRWTVVSSFLIFLLLTAGRPEVSLPEIFLLVALIIWGRFFRMDTRKGAWRWQLRALFIGGLLSMPSLLPALEYMGLSRRSSGMLPSEVFQFSANWYDLLCLFAPQPLGDLQLRWSFLKPLVMPIALVPYIASAYIGPIGFALAIFGMTDKNWKARKILFLALVIVVIVSLGGNTPVMPWILQMLPRLAILRFPIKFLFFATFILAIFAGRGAYCLGMGIVRRRVAIAFLLAPVLIGLALASLALAHVQWLQPYNPLPKLLIEKGQWMIGSSLLVASVVALIFALLSTAKKWRSRSLAASLVLLAFSLLRYAATYTNHDAKADYFQQPSTVAELIRHSEPAAEDLSTYRVTGLNIELFTVPRAFLTADGKRSSIGTYQYMRQVLLPNTNMDFAMRSASGFECSMIGDYYYLLLNLYTKSSLATTRNAASQTVPADAGIYHFCQLNATRFVITQLWNLAPNSCVLPTPTLNPQFFELIKEVRILNLRLYRVKAALPRAYFSSKWRWQDSHGEVEHRIFTSESSGFDPTICTELEHMPGLENNSLEPPDNGCVMPVAAKVSFLADSPDLVSIHTGSDRSGILVLADQNYPGWRAKVDGQSCPIFTANAFTRAVFVPKGEHTVAFTYRPVSLYAGIALSIVALIWLVLLRRID